MDLYAFDDYWLTEFLWHKWYLSALFEVIFFVFECFDLFVIGFAFLFCEKVLTFFGLLCKFASLVFQAHVVEESASGEDESFLLDRICNDLFWEELKEFEYGKHLDMEVMILKKRCNLLKM